jgi:pimeloyl-ACP methyl ester carboxylesterase
MKLEFVIKPALSILLSTAFFMPIAQAKTESTVPNLEREKRMASEVEDAVLDGEVVYLKDGEHSFMAIDTEAEDVTKGALIILHGRGFHPNWQDTVYPLRTQLPSKGWRTLALQMPVLEKSAKYYDYEPVFPLAAPRIDAGIEYLKKQGVDNIVLLAHSCGAHMAMDWFRNGGNKKGDIKAYIGAGMGATDFGQNMKKPFPLADLTIPVMDVYGEKEYPAVRSKAPERLLMITKAANSKSRQIIVSGANHYFTDKGDELVAAVEKWLEAL